MTQETLIYRRIEHLFSCDGEMIWFTGTILGYNKDTEEVSVALYYDNEHVMTTISADFL